MYDELLSKAEASHDDLVKAYAVLNEERARFQKLLGAEAQGAAAAGMLRKYGPIILKYVTAATGGAGGLAVIGNFFPSIAKALGLGG